MNRPLSHQFIRLNAHASCVLLNRGKQKQQQRQQHKEPRQPQQQHKEQRQQHEKQRQLKPFIACSTWVATCHTEQHHVSGLTCAQLHLIEYSQLVCRRVEVPVEPKHQLLVVVRQFDAEQHVSLQPSALANIQNLSPLLVARIRYHCHNCFFIRRLHSAEHPDSSCNHTSFNLCSLCGVYLVPFKSRILFLIFR